MSNLSSEDDRNALFSEIFPSPRPLKLAAISIALNAFSSITACIGNVLILVALYKVTSISPPTKILFVSLAVTDLLTGLILQPLLVVHAIITSVIISTNLSYFSEQVNSVLGFILTTLSILTSTAISVDRLLALVLGLVYRNVVTLRRVRVIVICIWLLSCMLGGWRCTTVAADLAKLVFLVVVGLCFITSIASYIKIYSLLYRHRRQVHGHFKRAQQQSNRTAQLNEARFKKTVSSIAWIQFTLILLFIPCIVVAILWINKIIPSGIPGAILFRVSFSVFYLNSSLNPILYVWKIREVKNIVKADLMKLKCC
ncbi:adenosine receptor A3-like [Pocillopora damicornis]|uniref:adenosine receptor A3-like n=1 Tax=Pocillopora damicornis TaxID=46731 RepID=UPI000F559941|nr:adenosine receptor A3-like [Pocillopora damicornis]